MSETVVVEIRAAEGGEDAKLLVHSQFAVYARTAERRGLETEIVDERPGLLVFRASGPSAMADFANEAGGHRWQRIPPTEKRGRVQTSTVTVAVLREPAESEIRLVESDLDVKTARGSGPGGQNRNKTESAVIVTHKPTGLAVRCDTQRSQHQNRATAMGLLRAKLLQRTTETSAAAANDSRRTQVGSGMRGDKIRTVRCQDGIVTDHRLGVKLSLTKYARGLLPGMQETK